MVPPPCQTTGRSRQRRHFSEPFAATGEKPHKGIGSGRPRVTARRHDPQQTRLTNTGGTHKVLADVPLTKGTPREQCRRRPKGHDGCEEDDRLRYRDSAQRRPTTSIGRMRELSYFIAVRLSHQPASRRARSCPPIVPISALAAAAATRPPARKRPHRSPLRARSCEKLARECPAFRTHGPGIERGRSQRRQRATAAPAA